MGGWVSWEVGGWEGGRDSVPTCNVFCLAIDHIMQRLFPSDDEAGTQVFSSFPSFSSSFSYCSG